MQEDNAQPIQTEEFGMSQEDVKNYQIKSAWGNVKHIFYVIGPGLVSALNTLIYWSLKFAKGFVSSVIRMVVNGG